MTGSCDQALLNFDVLTVTAIEERNEFNGHLDSYPFAACAPSSSIESFPAKVSGVMALSSSRYVWPAFLYQPLSITYYLYVFQANHLPLGLCSLGRDLITFFPNRMSM
ncbi:hypothetical protein Hanom_Chr10g00949681 [Helianthus anomalus]